MDSLTFAWIDSWLDEAAQRDMYPSQEVVDRLLDLRTVLDTETRL